MKVVFLKISSYRGISIGAVHFYARLHYYDEDKKYQTEEIKRILTKKEVLELNKQDRRRYPGCNNTWKVGFEYQGFWSEEDAKEAAINYVKEKMPDVDFLIEGSWGSADVRECIYAKDEAVMTKINKLHERAKKIGFHDNPKHKEKMDRINEQYWRLTGMPYTIYKRKTK